MVSAILLTIDAVDTVNTTSWIVDSGTADHMTYKFGTYKSSPKPKYNNGRDSPTTIAGQGNIMLTPSILLQMSCMSPNCLLT